MGPLSFDKPLPQFEIISRLGKAALWHASYRFPTEPENAIQDLSIRAAMAQYENKLLIGILIGVSFERGAVDLIRENAAFLQGTPADRTREFLNASRLNDDIAGAMEGETNGLTDFGNRIAAMSDEERARLIESMFSNAEPDAGPRAKSLEKALADPKNVAAELVYLRTLNRTFAESIHWPEERFTAWSNDVLSGFTEHPLAAVSFPAIQGIRNRLIHSQVEREMLKTGLSILESGVETLGASRDPFTGRAFRLQYTANGFALESAFTFKGKPLKMNFPAAFSH